MCLFVCVSVCVCVCVCVFIKMIRIDDLIIFLLLNNRTSKLTTAEMNLDIAVVVCIMPSSNDFRIFCCSSTYLQLQSLNF